MRSISRFLLGLLLLVAIGVNASASVATTTHDLTATDNSKVNKVLTAATVNATENIVIVQITTKARTVEFTSDVAWIYRSASSGTDFKVAAGQTLTLHFSTTSTFYHVRQSADGTLSAVVIE